MVIKRTLLCVVIPRAPQPQLLDRFVAAAQNRISQIPVPAFALMQERAALADVRLGRATSRSVIGSMNQFAYAIDAWFEHRSGYDLEALGLWLCDTPCSPLRTTWPWLEAELLLGDTVASDRRPLRFGDPVIWRTLRPASIRSWRPVYTQYILFNDR